MIDLKNIDHIGIAVKNIEEKLKAYELLGFKCESIEEVKEQKVKVAFLPVGDSELELLEPTSEDSPVQKFIDKKGEGMHHIAIRVDDVQKTIDELKEAGVRMFQPQTLYPAL